MQKAVIKNVWKKYTPPSTRWDNDSIGKWQREMREKNKRRDDERTQREKGTEMGVIFRCKD